MEVKSCKEGRANRVETTGSVEAGLADPFERLLSAATDLSQLQTVAEVAERALGHLLDMTSATVAFIALADESGHFKEVHSRGVDGDDPLPPGSVEKLAGSVGGNGITWTGGVAGGVSTVRTYCGQPLTAGGQTIGMIGVTSTGFTLAQQRAFATFATHVGAVLGVAQLQERRQAMVDTLLNLRADLDRSEKQRLLNEERARSTERVERAHEAAVEALLAVSVHARSGHSLTDFYRRLTASIAELVGAGKVLFWQLDEQGNLVAIPGAHGIDADFVARLYPAPCSPQGEDLPSRVVFGDLLFKASRADGAGEFGHVLDVLGVNDAIAVSWRAGEHRLGLLAAYDSQRPEGFSREDAWVLQKAGLAAGLVWQLRYTDSDLEKTVERLQKVDAARQLLLKNVSTAVDRARRHLAAQLHDDALQKLTGVELHLQRLQEIHGEASPLREARNLLTETEDALRRLLFEVRPPALEKPGGFEETVRDRIEIMRSLTGARVEAEVDLPEDLSYESKSMVFRQVAEALTNVEKHASAREVRITLGHSGGAIHGLVSDNGRGFVVSERDHLPGHLGLLALNERALLAGGWTKITSEPGVGTTVEWWMPVSRES